MRKGDFLHVAPQIGEDLLTRTLVGGVSLFEECQRALNNTMAILRYAGCTYRNVVLFSWESTEISHLELIDVCQASLDMNSGTPDTVSASVGYVSVAQTLNNFSSIVRNRRSDSRMLQC